VPFYIFFIYNGEQYAKVTGRFIGLRCSRAQVKKSLTDIYTAR